MERLPTGIHSVTSKLATGTMDDAQRLVAIRAIEDFTKRGMFKHSNSLVDALEAHDTSPTTPIIAALPDSLKEEERYGDEPEISVAVSYEPPSTKTVTKTYGGEKFGGDPEVELESVEKTDESKLGTEKESSDTTKLSSETSSKTKTTTKTAIKKTIVPQHFPEGT